MIESVFTEPRFHEPIQGIDKTQESWRLKERARVTSVALVLCLNIGVDPPDVIKTQPCAKLEAWVDPTSNSPTRIAETIANELQRQYEQWQPRARYKQSLDPTVEDIKKLCTSLRRNAKHERVLFHYNGHGVPKPTVNGEIWVFNKSFTQYIPLSLYDLQQWMGVPSIYVWDCSSSGLIVETFNQFATQRQSELANATNNFVVTNGHTAQGGQNNPSSNHLHENQVNNQDNCLPHRVTNVNSHRNETQNRQPTNNQGQQRLNSHGNRHPNSSSESTSQTNASSSVNYSINNYAENNVVKIDYGKYIQLAACSKDELLPMNPDLPADLFTACLTTPIKIALMWFVKSRSGSLLPQVTLEMLDKIPGKLSDRRTMLGELNWIFTAITDTIAWNTLPKKLFQELFRQDSLVASLMRNFLLADRIMRSYDCTPVSSPELPSAAHHPMWLAWDLAVDASLSQLPNIIKYETPYQHSSFFSDQLTAFSVWLSGCSPQTSQPEQLPIVLQVLLSQVHRLRALDLLSDFLHLGPWAVHLGLSVGIFPYVLKLLQSSARELRPLLVFIWAKILSVEPNVQADLVNCTSIAATVAASTNNNNNSNSAVINTNGSNFSTVNSVAATNAANAANAAAMAAVAAANSASASSGHKYFISLLSDPIMGPEYKAMALFVLSMIIREYRPGQEAANQDNLIFICFEQIDASNSADQQLGGPNSCAANARLRKWACICLGLIWQRYENAYWRGHRDNAHQKLIDLLNLESEPEIRAAAVFALGTFVSCTCLEDSQSNSQINLQVAVSLINNNVHMDGSILVRKELLVALQWILASHATHFSALLNQRDCVDSSSVSSHKSSPSASPSSINSHLMNGSCTSGSSLPMHQSYVPSPNVRSEYPKIWNVLCSLRYDPCHEICLMAEKLVDAIKRNPFASKDETFSNSTSSLSSLQQSSIQCPLIETDFVNWSSKFFVNSKSNHPYKRSNSIEKDEEKIVQCQNYRLKMLSELNRTEPTKLDQNLITYRTQEKARLIVIHPYLPIFVTAHKEKFSIWKWQGLTKSLPVTQTTTTSSYLPTLSSAGSSISPFPVDQVGKEPVRAVTKVNHKITWIDFLNCKVQNHLMVAMASDDGVVKVWSVPDESSNQKCKFVTGFTLTASEQNGHSPSNHTLYQSTFNHNGSPHNGFVPNYNHNNNNNSSGSLFAKSINHPIVCKWDERNSSLIAGGHSKFIRIFDCRSEKVRQDIKVDVSSGAVTSIDTDGSGIILTGSQNGSVTIYDTRAKEKNGVVKNFRSHNNPIVTVGIAEPHEMFDGSKVYVTIDSSGHFRLHDSQCTIRQPAQDPRGSESMHVKSAAIHPVADTVAIANNGTVAIHSFCGSAGSVIKCVSSTSSLMTQRQPAVVECVAYHPLRPILAAGTSDNWISFWSSSFTK